MNWNNYRNKSWTQNISVVGEFKSEKKKDFFFLFLQNNRSSPKSVVRDRFKGWHGVQRPNKCVL